MACENALAAWREKYPDGSYPTDLTGTMRPPLLVTKDTAQARLSLGIVERSRHLKGAKRSTAPGRMPDRGSVMNGRIGVPVQRPDESEGAQRAKATRSEVWGCGVRWNRSSKVCGAKH